ELAVGFAATHASSGTITSTASGYKPTTQRISPVSNALVSVLTAYKLNAGIAAETYKATTPSGYWDAGVVTFKPKSGGASLSWSGLSPSPNGAAPRYPTNPVTFNRGAATVSIAAYDAQTTSLHVTD